MNESPPTDAFRAPQPRIESLPRDVNVVLQVHKIVERIEHAGHVLPMSPGEIEWMRELRMNIDAHCNVLGQCQWREMPADVVRVGIDDYDDALELKFRQAAQYL